MDQNLSILVAGIGNIFLADDAFGVEVVRELLTQTISPQVEVVDFGIRSYDLAYALTEPYQAIILVDATLRGGAPGTVYLMEPEVNAAASFAPGVLDPHSLDPVKVLQMAQSFGGITAVLYLVGCEPAALEHGQDDIRLSEPVRAAVPRAVDLINSLISGLLNSPPKPSAGLVPA